MAKCLEIRHIINLSFPLDHDCKSVVMDVCNG